MLTFVGVAGTDDMRFYVVVLIFVAAVQAMPAEQESADSGIGGSVLGIVKDCVDDDVYLCLKVVIVK